MPAARAHRTFLSPGWNRSTARRIAPGAQALVDDRPARTGGRPGRRARGTVRSGILHVPVPPASYVVDPLDGRVLWHRDDLEAASGLMNEPFLGIIGDEQVLAVFASNGANYTLYNTASGAE